MTRKFNIGNAICSTALFHFTHKKTVFKKILKNGIRYSYSAEFVPQFFAENSENIALSIPIICFCDIPLIRISSHVRKYGSYGVGINKANIIKKLGESINPLYYVNSNEIIQVLCNIKVLAKSMQNQGFAEISQNQLVAMSDNNYIKSSKLLKSIDLLYAFFKPYQYDGIDFTQEREWRAILKEDLRKGISWNSESSRKEYNDQTGKTTTVAASSCTMFNEIIGDNPLFHLQFSESEILDCIEYIIVPNRRQKDWCIDFIKKSNFLFGCNNLSEDTKLSLISKICCLEQLEIDY